MTTLEGSQGELRPQTLLLRHYDCWTVSYLAYWSLGGGGMSSAPLCTLGLGDRHLSGLLAWGEGGRVGVGDGVLIPNLL